MGREIRRVPANWEHPKDERGNYKPLLDSDFETEARKWLDACKAWDEGLPIKWSARFIGNGMATRQTLTIIARSGATKIGRIIRFTRRLRREHLPARCLRRLMN